ncbi:hypothetical protein H4219_004538 [Mycoemilia scoparia]|uniref:Uncharacterized protein n=1 Tax=Mycoemilia scoparia TaxID=417184 RepID=A0A9W8DR69_9FUNG|nr:hypothetical protein H4219_004538 [Mycoemilia scoparia]
MSQADPDYIIPQFLVDRGHLARKHRPETPCRLSHLSSNSNTDSSNNNNKRLSNDLSLVTSLEPRRPNTLYTCNSNIYNVFAMKETKRNRRMIQVYRPPPPTLLTPPTSPQNCNQRELRQCQSFPALRTKHRESVRHAPTLTNHDEHEDTDDDVEDEIVEPMDSSSYNSSLPDLIQEDNNDSGSDNDQDSDSDDDDTSITPILGSIHLYHQHKPTGYGCSGNNDNSSYYPGNNNPSAGRFGSSFGGLLILSDSPKLIMI